MANLEKAMEKEQEYIAYRMKGEEPFHLADAVKECGFETLEQYFTAKHRHEIAQMGVVQVTQAEWLGEATRYINEGLHKTAYLVVENPVVGVYSKSQVDEEVCNTLGYEVVETYNDASAVVHSKGDILFGHFCTTDIGWHRLFIEHFVNWLKGKGLNADYVSNDIVVDGYKVCGMAVTKYGELTYTAGFIGINTNLDHIKAICRKPMNKVPKGLSEYGITTEEVEAMFLAFCET